MTIGSIFAYYAFGDPDESECYVYGDDGGVQFVSPLKPPEEYLKNGYYDVGKEFHIFFLMGFLLMLSQQVYTFFGVMFVMKKRHIYKKLAQITIGITGVATFIWMILGSVFRWRDAGQLCSETYLYKAGKFMKVYLIILYVVIPLFMCCGLLVLIGKKKA